MIVCSVRFQHKKTTKLNYLTISGWKNYNQRYALASVQQGTPVNNTRKERFSAQIAHLFSETRYEVANEAINSRKSQKKQVVRCPRAVPQ